MFFRNTKRVLKIYTEHFLRGILKYFYVKQKTAVHQLPLAANRNIFGRLIMF